MQPVIAVCTNFDGSERGVHEFAGTQARAVAEVDQEAQPLGGARLPALRPIQPVGVGLNLSSFGRSERACSS
jgi:hypothetical protein